MRCWPFLGIPPFLLLILTAQAVSQPRDDAFARQVQALAVLRDFAISICSSPSHTGISQSQQMQGQVSATVNRIVKIGVQGSAQFQTESYQGVLRADLATALKNTDECRFRVLQLLVDRLLGSIGQIPQRPPEPPPAPGTAPQAPILRVFRKDNLTTADVNALARLLPTFTVTTGQSAIDRRNPADVLFVNRDRVSPGEVMAVADALGRLGVQIKSVQQSALGGRREIQIGTIMSGDESGGIFWSSEPLNFRRLRTLPGNEFWLQAFNGQAFCQDGIGVMMYCDIGQNGRPVRP